MGGINIEENLKDQSAGFLVCYASRQKANVLNRTGLCLGTFQISYTVLFQP